MDAMFALDTDPWEEIWREVFCREYLWNLLVADDPLFTAPAAPDAKPEQDTSKSPNEPLRVDSPSTCINDPQLTMLCASEYGFVFLFEDSPFLNPTF